MKIQLLKGDCLERMAELPEHSVDLILTDPPYGTTQSKWDSIIPLEPMWDACKRVLKPTGVMVFTAAQPFSSVLVASNLDQFAYEWIWVKTKVTGVLNAKKMPMRQHEQILVFSATKCTQTYNAQGLLPKNSLTKQGGNSDNYGKRSSDAYFQEFTNWPRDVLEFRSAGKTVHPTQKPVELMEYLIKTYTHPGDTVLDFTCGSGTTGVAAVNTDRAFIGIELDSTYFDIAHERIKTACDIHKIKSPAAAPVIHDLFDQAS